MPPFAFCCTTWRGRVLDCHGDIDPSPFCPFFFYHHCLQTLTDGAGHGDRSRALRISAIVDANSNFTISSALLEVNYSPPPWTRKSVSFCLHLACGRLLIVVVLSTPGRWPSWKLNLFHLQSRPPATVLLPHSQRLSYIIAAMEKL